MGLMLALALILSYVETLIPFQVGIPGIKLGLANLAVVLCLYLFDWKEALILTIIKAVVAGFLFGSLFTILYSLAGALMSFAVMALLHKWGGIRMLVLSGAGGVAHNIGQLLVAYFAVEAYSLIYYVPVLILAGLTTGLIIGIIGTLVLPAVQAAIGAARKGAIS